MSAITLNDTQFSTGDLWVFGYGSLMWRPGFEFTERVPARLIGEHRALCVYSFVHRGTPENPGLVLGLDRGGACRGVAFRVAEKHSAATVAYLREREQVTSVYREVKRSVWLENDARQRVSALVYVVDRGHVQYAGRLSPAEQLRHVLQGHGQSGVNRDYVLATVKAIEAEGFRDQQLHRLAMMLHDAHHPVLPAKNSDRSAGDRAARYKKGANGGDETAHSHQRREAMDLKGAVALVTGGNGGLGQRICHALAQEGADVAVMYARSREQAEGVASELVSRYQIRAQAFACDISDDAAVDRLVGEVTRAFGRLDVLINDAAYNVSIPFGDLDSLTLEVWDKVMAVNLTGPMRLTKAVAPIMKAQGRGRIINIASVAGLSPTGSSIAYAVSKAGLIHLTRCMAVALAPETLVNCVAPGLLEGTRATANLRSEQIERSASSSLLKKAADKDDCADMVVAMCRTETMTGQTVVIDAGRIFH